MARILVPQAQYKWTLSLEPCPNTGVGVSDNNQHEYAASSRHNEDRIFNGRAQGIELCMVLDGHDGEKAADFARLHIPGKLLADRMVGGPDEVCQRIHNAFRETEMQFFMALDDALTRKLSLQSEISSRARNSYEAQRLYPDQVQEINRLESQIRGGTTVVLSLITNNRLYIANVGDSRAILCQNNNGNIIASQLSDDHNVYNPGEQERLTRLGLDIDLLVSCGRLGAYQTTRSIGDYDIKGGYRDVDILSRAKEEPGICHPFINGPWSVSDLRNSFLLLMSDGLYEAYGTYIKSGNPQEIHEGIASIVIKGMSTSASVGEVAQATIERVKMLLKSLPGPVPRFDDISLLISNFSHPIRGADQVDGGGEFVPEEDIPSPWQKDPAPSTESELITKIDTVKIDQGGPSNTDPVFPSPIELTKEQKESGKFIVPYTLFPLQFPYDKGLDDF